MFTAAKPIFLQGLSAERDVQAGFMLQFEIARLPSACVLRCAAATFYRAYLDGKLIAYGPARAAHGCARVDEIDLTQSLSIGRHQIAIEVGGYNLDCITVAGQSSFVCAEVVCDGAVIAATGEGCLALHLIQRRPAERFSHARCWGEVYALDQAFYDWRLGRLPNGRAMPVEIVTMPSKLLPRGVPLPDFAESPRPMVIGAHTMQHDATIVVRPIGPLESEQYLQSIAALPERPATECAMERAIALQGNLSITRDAAVLSDLPAPAAIDFDFGLMQAGFLKIDFETCGPATIDLVFVDHLEFDGTIAPRGGDMNGVIRLHTPGGRFEFTAFEPHCLRYLRVIARETPSLTIHRVGVIDYSYPDRPTGTFLCADGDLNRIYAAARLTLRLNTQDVFMDCPGRERAGWLCDSLFSGRAMQVLFGDLSVERAMLENFLHAPQSDESPGYFPECYPGRAISGGNFIPNWSMFLALELAEYVQRSGDRAFGEAYRTRIDALVAGIERSANEFGLLERLPGFTFIDWSKANENDYKHPISTPTNALYARMLDAMSVLYQRPVWAERAASIRATLRSFIVENQPIPDGIRREGGRLVAQPLCSEAAQYYHFWTGISDAKGSAAGWWEQLLHGYGPTPQSAAEASLLAPSNVFIGLYLRLESMAMLSEHERLLREMRALFLPMLARGPGTLWEHLRLEGSVCHGFASHAAVWLVRDILGIGLPDAIDKTVNIAPHPAGLSWAAGSILIDGELLSVDWRIEPGRFALNATIPDGHRARIELPAEYVDACVVNGHPIEHRQFCERTFSGAITLMATMCE